MEIENYDEQPTGSNIVAIFDVYLSGARLRLRRLKLIRSKAGKLFVSLPSYGVDDGFGKKKFIPYIEFTGERENEFKIKLMQELTPFIKVT